MSADAVQVALDLAPLQAEGWADRGVGRYSAALAAALDRAGALLVGLLDPTGPPPDGLPSRIVQEGRAAWDGRAVARRLSGPGVWHQITAPFLGFETGEEPGNPAWTEAGVPRSVVLYDLIPLRAPRHYLSAPGAEDAYRRRAAWAAASDRLLAISDHSRQEAIDLLGCPPERVVTIGTGVSEFFCQADGTDDGRWAPVGRVVGDTPFVFTVTGSDERKGAEQSVVALGRLVERGYDVNLVVAGHLTSEWRRRLSLAAAGCGVAGRVFLLGAVDDDLLRGAYRRAAVTILPSLAEGAGLPVLESAACGTPALASAGTALAETAAIATALFDPTDADDIAASVAAVLDSPSRRAQIVAVQGQAARRATWDAVAARAVAAMGAAGGGRDLVRPAVTVAVVGAGPTGGPDWLRATLSQERVHGGAPVRVDGFGADAVPDRRALAAYDEVVYVLGPDDGEVRRAAAVTPGWLWPGGAQPASRWEPLVRRSRGVVVADAAQWAEIRLGFDPWSAMPPVVVADEARGGLVGG